MSWTSCTYELNILHLFDSRNAMSYDFNPQTRRFIYQAMLSSKTLFGWVFRVLPLYHLPPICSVYFTLVSQNSVWINGIYGSTMSNPNSFAEYLRMNCCDLIGWVWYIQCMVFKRAIEMIPSQTWKISGKLTTPKTPHTLNITMPPIFLDPKKISSSCFPQNRILP